MQISKKLMKDLSRARYNKGLERTHMKESAKRK